MPVVTILRRCIQEMKGKQLFSSSKVQQDLLLLVGLGRRADRVGLEWFAIGDQYLGVCQYLPESV